MQGLLRSPYPLWPVVGFVLGGTLKAQGVHRPRMGGALIQLCPKLEHKYLSLVHYPSMDYGWQRSLLHVPNENPPLPSYSCDRLRGDLPESWAELPPQEAYRAHVPTLLDAIKDLKDWGLTGMRVIRTFIGCRVLPLKMRQHPQWPFQGPKDPTIELMVTISEDDLDQRVMKVMGDYTMDRGQWSPRWPSAPAIVH
jgi:hypothetical protein